MDSLCLPVVQMLRSRDLVIFVLTDRQTGGQNQLLYPLLRMHEGSNNQFYNTVIAMPRTQLQALALRFHVDYHEND